MKRGAFLLGAIFGVLAYLKHHHHRSTAEHECLMCPGDLWGQS